MKQRSCLLPQENELGETALVNDLGFASKDIASELEEVL